MYLELAVFIVALLIIIAYFTAIFMLIKAIRIKGHHQQGAAILFFLGFFASPIVLGLYAAALPNCTSANMTASSSTLPSQDEMPEI